MIERSRRVVLLIDYDNLQICASRDTPGRDLQLPPIVQLAQHYGTVIMARAYAEWNLSTERLAVYKAGIEPAFAPVLRTESDRSGKSLADTVMVAEGMDMLWTLSPDVVVLATSDKDLIPLVRVAKQRGAFVVVLGSDFTAIPLREMADEHVTYKQLITDSQGRYVTEAGPARQPAALPEPAARRRPTRERNGRERTLITPPVPAPSVSASPSPARVERETPPAPAQSPAAPGAGPIEPVAPLSVGVSAEGDAQGLGRRRRRRGSRRRSERVGIGSESTANGEGESSFTESSYAEGTPPEGSGAEMPYDDDDVDELSASSELIPTRTGELFDVPTTTSIELPPAPVSPSPVEADAEITVPAPAPAAPRNRRRTARRPTATIAATSSGIAEEPAATLPLPSASQTPDILWAAEPPPPNGVPAAANGTPSPAEPTAGAADGEPIAEQPAASPRPRSRRITSGSRRRTSS